MKRLIHICQNLRSYQTTKVLRTFVVSLARVSPIYIILAFGLILLGACNANGGESNIEASPTPVIVDGVNLSLVGNTGRPQFIYAFAKW